PPAEAASAPARPRIGLVLGGGGARGAAHIGVIETLERLHVPVDCVAGTSMGALVAGAWAAGLSPAQMRAELSRADWADMFQDSPGYPELNFREKRLSQRFLPGTETGLRDGSTLGPPGFVNGQKIKLFFNHLVRADAGQRLIEDLPLPVSIVATDIGTGARVVLRSGSLTQAMRASMSVPGLLAPLDYEGRKLVDGGLVDNVPIREVRQRCHPDVVIAVDVGSPPLRPDQVTSLLTVTAQMVSLLTEQNVQASLALLRPQDILIRPDLGDIGAADFSRHEEAADRGRAAAEALAARLAPLAMDAADYAAWRGRIEVQEPPAPRIDRIEIAGLKRVNPEAVRRYIEQRTGRPLDTAELNRDLLRAYGDGDYERVDYSVLTEDGQHVLRITPVEKSWGPDYLRFALRLETNLSQGSTYLLRAGYERTWINPLGGDLLYTAEIGSTSGVGVDYYQPLDAAQRTFFDARAGYRRERTDYWVLDQRVAQYSTARTTGALLAGVNFMRLGQLSLGWVESQVNHTLVTGTDLFALLPQRAGGGWKIALDMDRLDRLYFSSRGWSTHASWFSSDRLGYGKVVLDNRAAWPWHRWVLGARASWVGATHGSRLPISDAGTLGGFLNLTGFARGQLIGDDIAYAHVRAERIIGRAPLGLSGDLRLGLAVEAGRVGHPYTQQQHNGWLYSLAAYLGGEGPLGPAYVGLGLGTGKSVNAYLVIGAP
ncbi:MAG: patatin-like phospholipase family protein, partial [Burkholderiales bacterium]|nr:patatin-like phospholipase family protein [Burkholderiales bacterium]